jgi:hypothetical protein
MTIERFGWRRVRPLIINVLGHANGGRRRRWRYEVDEESGPQILNELNTLETNGVVSNADCRVVDTPHLFNDNCSMEKHHNATSPRHN